MSDRIILCGPYASGKTTLGKRLAHHLGWAFLDGDEALGEVARELHIQLGEEAFRERELSVLREHLAQRQSVIATGGGCVVTSEGRAMLKSAHPVVYLKVAKGELWKRWVRRGTPHFAPSKEAYERYLDERLPLYEEVADSVVLANDLENALWEVIGLAKSFKSPRGGNLTEAR